MNTYKLENICTEIYSGGTPSTKIPEYWNGDLKWLSSGETSNDFIKDTIQHITKLGVDNSSTRLAKKHSVVMACAGQGKTRGQVSYTLNDMYVNQSVIVLAPNDRMVNSLYLFYNLKNRYNELRGGSDASSTRGSITTTALKRLPIELPDIEQQSQIANILKTYDDLIEKNNRKIEILQDMAEELYKEWFVRFRFPGYKTAKFTDGIPDGWEYIKLENLAYISTGKCNREDAEEDGIYPLFDRSQEIKKSNNWLKDCEAIIVPGEGTSFIPRYYKGKFNLHQRCYCVEPKQDNIGFFLFQTLMLNRIYFLYVATGATVPSLRQNNFTNFKVLMPKEELYAAYNKYSTTWFEEITKLEYQNENLKQQRDLLLPRLMSGKLEVKVS